MSLQRLSLPFARALAGLLLLVPLSAQAQTAPAGAKPTATISGKITVNEKGAPDILVVAQQLDRPFQQPAARAKTDANGRYRLTGLPAGQYQITAIAPALAPEQAGSSGPMSRIGKSLLLAPGEEADDVDIKLVQGAVITGRVTDADGKPVIEERINLQAVDQAGNVNNQGNVPVNYQMSQTDDRGVYRIYGLSAGRYRVSVGTTEGGFMSSRNRTYYPVTFYGNTSDAAKASVVELQDGTEAANIDIRVGRAANTFVASGRVVDAENGQPIPNLRLSYGPAKVNQPFYAYYVGSPASARGEFRLEGLEPGRYGVSVSSSFESSAHYADTIFFEIVDADVTNLEVKATRGQTLSGVVVFEGGRAKELQQNIALLRVGANVNSTSPGNSTSSSAAIAADGSFQLSGMRPGKARLYISAMPTSALRGITILRAERGGVDVTQNLEVQAGESITDLRIVASLGSGTVRGTVRFVGGDLPPNLRMFVTMRREGAPQAGGGMVDARGRFLISSLTSGTYEVVLNMNYVPPPPGGARPIKPQTQTVTVSDGVETQVDFIVDLTPKEGGP